MYLTRSCVVAFDAPTPRRFAVEVASTIPALRQGLAGRRLAVGEGLLMVLPQEGPQSVWMRGTIVPLDLVFMDAQRRIVKVVANAPPATLTLHTAHARFVLEVSAGSAQGLRAGQTARFEVL